MLVQQGHHPLRAALAGRAGQADDDGRHAADGGKGREQVRRELARADEDVGREERVVAEPSEVGRGARMTEEELALRGDEQDGEGGRRPCGPDLVAHGGSKPERLGDSNAVVGGEGDSGHRGRGDEGRRCRGG